MGEMDVFLNVENDELRLTCTATKTCPVLKLSATLLRIYFCQTSDVLQIWSLCLVERPWLLTIEMVIRYKENLVVFWMTSLYPWVSPDQNS